MYDLEERTGRYGEGIIELAQKLSRNPINDELARQIVRAGTSIGANYMEANGAESRKDFRHKIAICRKEAKETCHWLRMIVKADPNRKSECKALWSEAHELTLIFSSIITKLKK